MTVNNALALVFPGQGSQKVGMLSDFADSHILTSTFESASGVLGYDLWDLIKQGPQDQLNMTETTQPALLACSTVLWRLWQDAHGAAPAFVAGHSLGEWSALVAAEVVAFEDAVNLVRLRGRYMQEAVPAGVGAMAAIIGLDDDVVEAVCAKASALGVVAPVNYNSPGQLVIAGDKAAVDAAMAGCKEAGAKRALPLPVSAPFHTSLMKPAAERLAADMVDVAFNAPRIPVVHNVTAATETDAAAIKNIMIEQIYAPVRWVECVQYLAQQGICAAVEVGPGKVLGGLIKRIDKGIVCAATETQAGLEAALAAK